MKLYSSDPNWPKLWEAECVRDVFRNEVIIPWLTARIIKEDPKTISDLGCGTGYVSRKIALRSTILENKNWKLIDNNPKTISFTKKLWPKNVEAEFVECGIDEMPHLNSDFSFSAFSSLEFLVTDKLAKAVASSMAPNGLLVWIVPDTLEDILEAKNIRKKMTRLKSKGQFSIKKSQKINHLKEYPFIVQRSEIFTACFLRNGFSLTGLERKTASNGKSLFIYIFRKQFE